MRIVAFTQSLRSCWNHGNAHFLRGVLRELQALGHTVAAHEPEGSWSVENLLRDHGAAGLAASLAPYPELTALIDPPGFGQEHADSDADSGAALDAALDGADLVLVHEWNAPALVAGLGAARRKGGRFTLLFHDTHHRAVSEPAAMRAYDLSGYDGVLAFGETLAEVYRGWGWGNRVVVWHEAADTRLFRPPAVEGPREGLVWIGNWGDGERSAELEHFLFGPAARAGLPLDVWGVRYPDEALATLRRSGARYRGWLPNARAPEIFARHLATVHVPRRFYVESLPGIPTIRVFEALACGIPLVSAPWRDSEALFTPGSDFLVAPDGAAMERHLRDLANDPGLRAGLAAHGLRTIRAGHTCAHRAAELLAVAERLRR
ncbi:CgeB family protein [Methylobacterium aquaticum]|uniref:CgeB family protein n=1 Tax=Methylobacterium aquaticum TaxID=270351 RepID=UPI003D187708